MGTIISNLKARFGVDTTDFRRGLKDGEKAIADFKGVGEDTISDFASMFGVNMSAVSGAINTVGKSLNFLGQSFRGAAAGGETFAIAMKVIKNAALATGLGALIVALGSLIAYFKETEIGAKQLASGMKQIQAVKEVVFDRLGKFGAGILDLIKGNAVLGLMNMKDAFTGIREEAQNATETAKILAQDIYDLSYQERQFAVNRSAAMIEIDKLRLKSRDLELSAEERLAALNEAAAKEKEINKEALSIAASKISIAQRELALDGDNIDKKNALAQAYVEYNQLVSESIQFEYSLTRQKNSLIKEIEGQLAAQKKLNDASKVSGTGMSGLAPSVDTTTLKGMGGFGDGKNEMQEFSQASIDMANIFNDSLKSMAAGFGEWAGAWASGMATMRDGRQMVGLALGDMLIMLGKAAINAGIGIEAIKKAFATLGGVGAIIAGTALVAFGSSIKGSIAAINNARASAMEGTSIPGSAGSIRYAPATTLASGGNGKIELDGSVMLKLSGPDLIALLNNENTRVRIVT